MLSFMLNKFILENISSRVIIIKDNCSECKNYKANLAENNEENNLYHASGSKDINESEILCGCIYTDINESRQNLYLKLSFAIYNLSNDNVTENHNDKPRLVISFNFYSNEKPLNDRFFPNCIPCSIFI